ncbi:hypothetical protein HAX54_032988 [Datura stramonium]|uniref:dihydrofolate reductase n=1 Tax=Datura stramonium TaxID=4076 RepID=A0ABS8SD58_DATST|nr:hypothetical protein [Datura stramonium]
MASETNTGLSNSMGMLILLPQRTYRIVVATFEIWVLVRRKLPWRLPTDLKFFKGITGTTSDPLQKRMLLLWEERLGKAPLATIGSLAYGLSIENVFVIGGGEIFRDSLNARGCDAIHITEIETDIECDTFAPAIDTWMTGQALVLWPQIWLPDEIQFLESFPFLQLRKFSGEVLLKNSCGSSVDQQVLRSYKRRAFIFGMAMHPEIILIVLA